MIAKGSTVGADAERTLHRLEAFSDIVIGFCIAEMGINLLVPQHVADSRAIETSIVGFAISFFLISIVWWVHQRIFRTFFILTPVTLVLNFTLLGSLVLMVYTQQLVLHFMGHGYQVVDLLRMWMASYGLVYGLLSAMLWFGLRERWKALPIVDLRWGLQRASILSIGSLMFFLVGGGLAGYYSGVVLIAGPIAVFALRFAIPKIVDRIIATRS
jgi:Endosomal/lysosomal potassium channel TMEM175